MFKCGMCGKNTKPLETSNTIVTETRAKVYDVPRSDRARSRTPMSYKEIVKEIKVCSKCAGKPMPAAVENHTLGSSGVEQVLHTHLVGGSIPSPATN